MIEKECTQLSDVIGHLVDATLVLAGHNYKITVCLRVHTFVFEMMSRLIAKGIIRSNSIRQRRIGAAVKPPIGIRSNCDVWWTHVYCTALHARERCLFFPFNVLVSL